MKKKINKFIVLLLMCLILIPVGVVYADEVQISIDDINAEGGQTVEVPIILSGNTGICGANINIFYDKNLKLIDITKGSALENMTMTKPGDINSNPFTIVWDAMENDSTNGTIAVLKFVTPNVNGKYNINISYRDGDIVDGNLSPINASIKNGSISVESGNVPVPTFGTTISVDSVASKLGDSFTVPIRISGNTGICGATLTVNYNSSLKLTDITNGEALSTLVMTKPGSYSSCPFVLVWDGLESDDSDGVIAYLTFSAPNNPGIYDIAVSFNAGDIVDENLNPIKANIIQGDVNVTDGEFVTVNLDEQNYILISDKKESGIILISYYNKEGKIISFDILNNINGKVSAVSPQNTVKAKFMWWSEFNTLKPLCDVKNIGAK